MTLRDLYLTCDNVDYMTDVFICQGEKATSLEDLYPIQPIMEREVEYFRVRGKKMEVWLK